MSAIERYLIEALDSATRLVAPLLAYAACRGPRVGECQAVSVTSTSRATALAVPGWAPGAPVTIDVPADGSTIFYGWADREDAAVDDTIAGQSNKSCACIPAGTRMTEVPSGAWFVAKVASGEDAVIIRFSRAS